jgi:gamma-glutamylputrescine oxidase
MKIMLNRWPGDTWYEATSSPPEFDRLAGRQRFRIAVIGAGLAGVSTAVSLSERGETDVCVLDAGEPGAGASGRNGGFVFAGYSLDNDALIAQIGSTAARTLHGWTRESVARIRARIDQYAIDCQVNDSGVLLADWFGDDARLFGFAKRMGEELGFGLDRIERERMGQYVRSRRYAAGLHEPGSFHFHPLQHIRGLARVIQRAGGAVFSDARVHSIARRQGQWHLACKGGQIIADEVVLATGGYDRRLYRPVQRALQPVATYIAVTEPLGDMIGELMPEPVAVYDTRFAFDYFRPLPDSRLLWGGRISMAARSPSAIRRLMARDIRRVFPELGGIRFDYAWGGWMSYARHQMPLLGRRTDGLWHALAFGGHGMATTTLAGEVLAEALTGDEGRMREFDRWPPLWAGGPAGRAWGQGYYWLSQARDWLRERIG